MVHFRCVWCLGLVQYGIGLAGWLACLPASCRSAFEDRFLKKKVETEKENRENYVAL